MSRNPESVFNEAALNNPSVCSRCFRQGTGKADRNNAYRGGAPCSDKCGTLSISLEERPLSANKIKTRGRRLQKLLEKKESDFDGEAFQRSLKHQSFTGRSPKQIFLEAISFGLGLRNFDGSESDDESGVDVEELDSGPWGQKEDSERAQKLFGDELSTLTVGRSSHVYYLEEQRDVDYHGQSFSFGPHSPEEVVSIATQSYEHWFWNSSPKTIDAWIQSLETPFNEFIVASFVDEISTQARLSKKSPHQLLMNSPVWAVFKDERKRIMGYLRRANSPKSTEEISNEIELDFRTTYHLLRGLLINESITTVNNSMSDPQWVPEQFDS